VREPFDSIAGLYDDLMAGIPYRGWVDYIRTLATRAGHEMRRVLDVGCGTGTPSLLLAEDGCHVVGIDASEGMVSEARAKMKPWHDASFIVARAENLRLTETFDTAISLFDSLNYITEPDAFRAALLRVYEHLEPGGLFIFDMNTPYALEEELFTQDNLDENTPVHYVWRSRFDESARLTRVDMTFLDSRGEQPRTITEVHYQRAYHLNEILDGLRRAGFGSVEMFEAFTLRRPGKKTDRAYFVARKPFVTAICY
jgi:ubiquinone/menaquinone biosynthesis C-methylase UbiE